jgi:two-component system chemotaxis response regulator CheB
MKTETKKSAAKRQLEEKTVLRLVKVDRLGTPAVSGKPATAGFPVIAMAASVGGLEALSVILGGLPADFPAAIAIVMHLAPDHESILAEILNRCTPLPVKQALTGDVLRPSWVFVAPPNHHLFVAPSGRLRLSSIDAKKINYARPSAEPLFVSVAAVYRRKAIAVVLTGGDGDGSFGVQVVKDHGGMVIAQDRPTSRDFSMPETSIETGDVDFILPLDEIAAKLIQLVNARPGAADRGTTPGKPGRQGNTPRHFVTPLLIEGTQSTSAKIPSMKRGARQGGVCRSRGLCEILPRAPGRAKIKSRAPAARAKIAPIKRSQ